MRSFTGHLSRRRALTAIGVAGLVCGVTLTQAAPARTLAGSRVNAPSRIGALAARPPISGPIGGPAGATTQSPPPPPTDAQCRAQFGTPCYSPQEIRRAYGITPLFASGYSGAGQTIVIIDSFGSPTIQRDLATFDAAFGLPAPPSFQVLSPLGTVPYTPNKIPDQVGWAVETSLDVEWAHAIAPGASIDLLTSPVDETEGVQGMPEFLKLEEYALDHHLGQIISQSWGATENTLFTLQGRQVLNNFNAFYLAAAQAGISVFASAGDFGDVNPDTKGGVYPFPTVGFPASDPFVTAVGGTSLSATVTGAYLNEIVWNDGNGSATGGGISQYFKEPAYQMTTLPSSDQALLNGFRGLPDIAYNADPNTGILVYLSMGTVTPGYYTIGGTSEGSPQWAGLAALGNQIAGRPLGFLNKALYELGIGSTAGQDFHDITQGNNTQYGITGYSAMPGWDAVTGWGSPNAASLLMGIVTLKRSSGFDTGVGS